MNEAQWQRKVEQLLDLYGWRWFHAPDNKPVGRTQQRQRVVPGYPDLTCVKRDRVLFVELKQDGKYPSADQRAWLADLHAAGQEVGIWKPADLPTVLRVLGPGQEPLVLPVRYRTPTG